MLMRQEASNHGRHHGVHGLKPSKKFKPRLPWRWLKFIKIT